MEKRRFCLILLLFAVLLATEAPSGYGEETIRKSGFSITLPDGWVEIPRDAIDAYEKTIRQELPALQAQRYDYGFQRDGSKGWFEYPYILIQVKNTGRIPRSLLEKLGEQPVQKALDDQKEKIGSIISETRADRMAYDRKSNMIWLQIEMNVQNIGPVSAMLGIVPTEKGVIQTNAYCLKKDYAYNAPVFHAVASSLTPDPELVYKTRWYDDLPLSDDDYSWKIFAVEIGLGALLCVIIFLVKHHRKKKGL